MENMDSLRSKSRNGGQGGKRRRRSRLDLLKRSQVPCLADFLDLAREIFAYPRQLTEIAAVGEHPGDALRQIFDRRGGSSIGAHAEGIGPFDLEKLGHPIELRGDVGVVDRHARALSANRASLNSITGRRRRSTSSASTRLTMRMAASPHEAGAHLPQEIIASRKGCEPALTQVKAIASRPLQFSASQARRRISTWPSLSPNCL
jgi:hypothetical protein